ncbi:alpha-xenorhabdolysin family binary toxin subunit A [Pseudomonas oryzicola]|uniref:Alpha-xenorhabdolysin family binary toxin subunit A n=1 Tax=Pseudomonas oryzicola TaxID=485876 RepID=A0ABS6Q7K3_9PSED|nr:alpha-xenorhabdolysin family binary toxin subunit A [Pseudomonas oryzicola]MBV4490170.1 alpha-xenorhabdolysin family binary toxin subunit A [Pseudomonas oryzicola]
MNIETQMEQPSIDEMDLVAKVKNLPERYFQFLESRAGAGQQVGSLLTAENLKVIKRYANTVNLLPRTLDQVREEADYETLGVDASMVYTLYEALHRHVYEWDKLERSIKQLGPEIELFAESLVERGHALLGNLERSEVFLALRSRKDEQGDDSYALELSHDEQAQIASIVTPGISGLVREIEDTRRRIEEVDRRAHWFYAEIKRELKPRMGRLLKHFSEKISDDVLLEKRRQIDLWDEQIDQLQGEYDANVGYAFTGLVLGPLGLIVTGGVFGSKAEKIRAEKNELIDKREELASLVGKMVPAFEDYERVSTLIRDLQFRCKDLSSATRRLADVWLFLASYANSSVNEAKELNTIHQLDTFVHDFAEVIKPWTKIGNICHRLSALFEELIEECGEA